MRERKTIVWGVFLIALGTVLTLERMGLLNVRPATLWPAFLWLIGTIQIAERRWGSGIGMILIGTVLFGCATGWHGLSYVRSWPLLLVAAGIGITVQALTGEPRLRMHRERDHV